MRWKMKAQWKCHCTCVCLHRQPCWPQWSGAGWRGSSMVAGLPGTPLSLQQQLESPSTPCIFSLIPGCLSCPLEALSDSLLLPAAITPPGTLTKSAAQHTRPCMAPFVRVKQDVCLHGCRLLSAVCTPLSVEVPELAGGAGALVRGSVCGGAIPGGKSRVPDKQQGQSAPAAKLCCSASGPASVASER